ncbi:hypothetical protein [Psychroserpens sp.]|uniref:hypothetical protein n=1 Tax=Psychroserpens sp. TaxID=2020870 RepID=UPI001B13E468|nr:hypothetical protein [Psychroserpens sp.]MBO6607346.1 hypothetical protein [Psychroserpens sp.]MBO6630798.1 hypothetical protein [Psychroserpens sp.]MBO6654578.1 hypothetical protein [Psychroserpens sp.]MBO6681075.1 hypothetical protein [Psychroserpens sp.]MBO6749970.1 hypothetical protein [Psychroserpens sp.]
MRKILTLISSLSTWLKLIINEMMNHIMSIVFILILYLMLWVVPQINDLIIVINQADDDWIAVFAFFASLSVLAFLISTINSYFDPPIPEEISELQANDDTQLSERKFKFNYIPRDRKEQYLESKTKFTIAETTSFSETQAEYIKRLFPKYLGTILILIAAYAVNNTYYDVYLENISFSFGNYGFLICLVLLLFSLYQPLMTFIMKYISRYNWTSYIPIAIAVISLLGIVLLGLFNQGGSQGDAQRLFFSLILLASFFLVVSVSYNTLVLKIKKWIGAPVIILFVIAIFSSYLILVFNPQALKFITPLSIVMICIIGIYTLCNLIKLIGHKKQVPLLTIVIIAAIGLSINTASKPDFDHYDATHVTTSLKASDRMKLDAYIDKWIEDRRVDILNSTSDSKFPIILVSAEGGGSRAGLWSFLVQSYLYDRNPDYFEKHLFSMTGASGGGGGNNMFYAQVYNLLDGKSNVPLKYKDARKDSLKYRASEIYNKDYLSTSVASLLGRDLIENITNWFCFPDRGALLENEWEQSFQETFMYTGTSPIAEAYLEMMPRADQYEYIRPILITNTTHLQSGQYAVMSPVSTHEDNENMGVFKDLIFEYPRPSEMIKRSTAMSMNARFPYLSPAARIKDVGQFGDAGYYDNVGGTVSRRLSFALERALLKDSALTGKYEIKHLLITNFEAKSELSYSSQLTAPASMIWNATFAHPKEMEKSMSNVTNVQSKRTEIPQDLSEMSFIRQMVEQEEVKPIIPLGRYLSQKAVLSMEARLKTAEVVAQLNSMVPIKSE